MLKKIFKILSFIYNFIIYSNDENVLILKFRFMKSIIKKPHELTYSNIDKARNLLNFNPKIGIDKGLIKQYQWHLTKL